MWKTPLKTLKGYERKYFKGCLPQILPGPFLNTLPHLYRFAELHGIFRIYEENYLLIHMEPKTKVINLLRESVFLPINITVGVLQFACEMLILLKKSTIIEK